MPISTSPVSWQVLAWILVSLAINSVAQPSGRIVPRISSRCRLYLCSSPIICIADALSMIIQFAAIVTYVRIPARTAALVVVHGRAEDPNAMIQEYEKGESKPGYLSAAWPRWLFFILGGLPPAIKLASLSGVPWTQAWGYFFVSSFVVIEIFTFVAHDVLHNGSPRLLDTSKATALLAPSFISARTAPFMATLPDHYLEEQRTDTRRKIAKISFALKSIPIFLLIIAALVHIGV